MGEIVAVCYLSDYQRKKGYSVIVAENGKYTHPAYLGCNYLEAVKGLSQWADENGFVYAGTGAWFKYRRAEQ